MPAKAVWRRVKGRRASAVTGSAVTGEERDVSYAHRGKG